MSGIGGIHGPGRIGSDLDAGPAHAPTADPAAAPAPAVSRLPTSSAWGARVAATAAGGTGAAHVTKPILHPGAKGEAVTRLQSSLNEHRAKLGLKEIPVTGNYGPQTKEAVVQFQKLWGLEADGAVGGNTWRRLLGEANPGPSIPVPGTITAKVLAHREAILSVSAKTGVPPAVLAGMIEKESGGRADVVGITGDKGLVQINPKAHPALFKNNSADWANAEKNLEFGARIFADNLQTFGGDVEKALAAYNAGCGGVRKGLRNGKTLDEITYKPKYVSNILKYAQRYQDYF